MIDLSKVAIGTKVQLRDGRVGMYIKRVPGYEYPYTITADKNVINCRKNGKSWVGVNTSDDVIKILEPVHCWQFDDRGDKKRFSLNIKEDLFIDLENGKTIRIALHNDGISIAAINGTKINIACLDSNMAGVKITGS